MPVSKQTKSDSGYMVAVKIVDQHGKTVNGAIVTLDKKTVKTDKKGIASFVNVPPGNHKVVVKTGKSSTTSTVGVNGQASADEVQQFSVTAKLSKSVSSWLYIAPGLVALLVLLYALSIYLRGGGGGFGKFGHHDSQLPPVAP